MANPCKPFAVLVFQYFNETHMTIHIAYHARVVNCVDCQATISRKAMFCPSCGAVPNVWRVGWFVFLILGAIGIFTSIFWAILNAILKVLSDT